MAKKNWISVFYKESRETTDTEQIIWESSSSEEDCFVATKTKRKKLSEINDKLSPVITIQRNNFDQMYNTDSYLGQSSESPVVGIKYLELYKLSPELSQRSASIFVKEPSPVIERRRVRLKKAHKFEENLIENHENQCECEHSSQNLFNQDSTQDISSESPLFSTFNSQATIQIEPFPSQFSSQVKPTYIQKKGKSLDIPLYYVPPKRKKKYKKGGLAYQLDKALQLKKSRVKIWHHEQVNNINNIIECNKNIINFKLKKISHEYGNTLLLCEFLSDSSLDNKQEGAANKDNIFLINTGISMILNIKWKVGDIYQLSPNYNVGRVMYSGQDILCYSNVSKFLFPEVL